MKKSVLALGLLWMTVGLSACSGALWTGLGGGALATGAGYEVNAKVKMDQLNKDFKDGKMDQKEYDIRKDQIQRMSLVY